MGIDSGSGLKDLIVSVFEWMTLVSIGAAVLFVGDLAISVMIAGSVQEDEKERNG